MQNLFGKAYADTLYVGLSDSRLTDARTPTSHKSTHVTGGSDAFTAAEIRGLLGVSTLSGSNTGDQDLSSYATTAAVAAGYLPLAGGTLTGLLTTAQSGGNNTGISMPSSGGAHSLSVATNVQVINSYNRTTIQRGGVTVFDSNGGNSAITTAVPSLPRGVFIESLSASNKAAVIRGKSGQSETLTDWQTSAGTTTAYVNATGYAAFAGLESTDKFCLAAITKSALLALSATTTAGHYRVTDGTYPNSEVYPDGTNWRYLVNGAKVSDDTGGIGGSSEPTSPSLVGLPMTMLPAAQGIIANIPNGAALTTQSLSIDTEYLSYFVAAYTFSIDRVYLSVSSGYSDNSEIVIYAVDTNGRPTGAAHRVSINSETGTQVATTSYSFTKGNMYAIGVRAIEDITVRAAANTSAMPLTWSSAATPVPTYSLVRSVSVGSTANYPTFVNTMFNTARAVWIGMRIA